MVRRVTADGSGARLEVRSPLWTRDPSPLSRSRVEPHQYGVVVLVTHLCRSRRPADLVAALARHAGSTAPFPDPGADDRRRPRRSRPLRPGPDRLGQDPRLRHPARRPRRPGRAAPAASASSSSRPVSSRRRSRGELAWLGRTRKLACRDRLRRRRLRRAAQGAAPRRRRPRRLPRSARRPRRAAATSTLDAVEIVVLDEADRMADMGFLPAVAQAARPHAATTRQTLLFSATLDGAVDVLVRKLPAATRSATSSPSDPETTLTADAPLLEGRARRPRRRMHGRRRRTRPGRRSCSAAPSAAPIASPSSSSGPACAPRAIHGDRSQGQRDRALTLHRDRRSTRSSPPTSPPVASTSTTVGVRRALRPAGRRRRTTSTVPAAPRVADRRAPSSRSSATGQARDVAAIQRTLGSPVGLMAAEPRRNLSRDGDTTPAPTGRRPRAPERVPGPETPRTAEPRQQHQESTDIKEQHHGNRYRQVVQRREGFRLHLP